VTAGPGKPILGRDRKTMIRLSQSRRAAALVLLGVAALLAGCCGGAPSHKCMFIPPAPPDSGSDAGFPCGTQVCQSPTVCCFTKIAPFAACVLPQDYKADGCEQLENACTAPGDCQPNGLVCCFGGGQSQALSCRPPSLCPGDGNPTTRICDTSADCTPSAPRCLVSGPDGGANEISYCY
jgi:hypothetical protein